MYLEPGQNRKIAALTDFIYVHLFFGGKLMKSKYMKMAINEARKAYKMGEVPVGAVIVKDDVVIAKAYNKKEKYGCVTGHAEILAVEKASKKLNNWRLNGCDIYITLEPCPMCASAIKQSRINNVYYGLSNSDKNNCELINAIFSKDKINSSSNVYCGYFSSEIEYLMKKFFETRRLNQK